MILPFLPWWPPRRRAPDHCFAAAAVSAEGAKGREEGGKGRVIPSFSTFSSEKNAGEEAATRQTHCEREEREGGTDLCFRACVYPVKRERDNRMAWHHPTRLNQEGEHSLYFTSSAIPWRERERKREPQQSCLFNPSSKYPFHNAVI